MGCWRFAAEAHFVGNGNARQSGLSSCVDRVGRLGVGGLRAEVKAECKPGVTSRKINNSERLLEANHTGTVQGLSTCDKRPFWVRSEAWLKPLFAVWWVYPLVAP